jgi:hypothetical protein
MKGGGGGCYTTAPLLEAASVTALYERDDLFLDCPENFVNKKYSHWLLSYEMQCHKSKGEVISA